MRPTDPALAPLPAGVLDHLLVLPCAHWRFQDFLWQHAVYSLFHRTWLARITHAVGMAPNTVLWIALAALLPLGPIDGGAALVAILAALYLWSDRVVGLVLLPVLAGMWWVAHAWIAAWGPDALRSTLVAAAAFAGVQSFGHLFEPIPPPWTGGPTFVPFVPWWRASSWGRRVAIGAMLPVGAVLEFWASPRLLPAQVMFVLGWLGYRRDFRADSDARAAAYGRDIRLAIENR